MVSHYDQEFRLWFITLLGNTAYGASVDAREEIADGLTESYKENENRVYHSHRHIIEMLDFIETSTKYGNADLIYAWFYHDCVYGTGTGDDEKLSAERFAADAKILKFPEWMTERICHYIMMTKHGSSLPELWNERLIADCDLWILASPFKRFKEYDEEIRMEYLDIKDEVFNRERLKFLQGMLEREAIYHSNEFRIPYEAKARINIKKIIKDKYTG